VPITTGRVIVATRVPHETTVLEEIRREGLELQVIFNKGAVMVLPSGVNKGTGLKHALAELCLSPRNCVAVGDAENDHVFLSAVELGAAVANALPGLKERADVVLRGSAEQGVVELIDAVLADDLRSLASRTTRHDIPLGDGRVSPVAGPLLFANVDAARKFLDAAIERGYQCCILDSEGRFEGFERAVQLGDAQRAPAVDEVCRALGKPDEQIVVDLRAVSGAERRSCVSTLLGRVHELRGRTGRPHWVALADAHQLLPTDRGLDDLAGVALVTDAPGKLPRRVLDQVQSAEAATRARAREG
jgi:hypothetical protein